MPKFIDFPNYSKDQVILTSGRLVFNAREDNLFLIAKKDVAISAGGDVHLNVGVKGSTTSKFVLNSPKIQLGLESKTSKSEPAAKADSAVKSIDLLINEISKLAKALSEGTGQVSGGTATLTSINVAADAFLKNITSVRDGLSDMKSKTTFTV